MAGILPFLQLIIRNGNLHNPWLDFHAWRTESLKELEYYLPKPVLPGTSMRWFSRNNVVHNLVAGAAQIKSSFRETGGHLTLPGKKFFYVRIPKSASTTIASEIFFQKNPELKDRLLTPTQINFLADAWLETGFGSLTGYTGFTIVRNPLERLVSVYRDIFQREEGQPFIYQNYLGGILSKELSFGELIQRISKIPDRLKDQHLKPQYLFIRPYQKRNIPVRVFKLEDPQAIREFLGDYGMGFPRVNQSMPYDYRDYYIQSTLNAVRKMYAHDFALFDYVQ